MKNEEMGWQDTQSAQSHTGAKAEGRMKNEETGWQDTQSAQSHLKPHQRHIKATPKRVASQLIGTPKPPQGYPKATPKPPRGEGRMKNAECRRAGFVSQMYTLVPGSNSEMAGLAVQSRWA